MVSLIAALTRDRVIGKGNRVPWDLPEDRKYFRDTTMGHAVIMGRNTWESIPAKYRPLPGRRNIVLSSRMPPTPGIDVCRSLDDAIALTQSYRCEPYIIGGAQVYAETLERDLADTMHLTWVDGAYEGDARFPTVDWSRWEEKTRIALNGCEVAVYLKRVEL